MRGVPRDRRAISRAASVVDRDAQDARRAADDLFDVGFRVEVEAMDDAEPRAQRRRQQPSPRRRADQRERLQRHLDRSRARPLADDDVELEVLHRRIEDLLDRRRQAVNLVDEEHFALAADWSAWPRGRPDVSITGPAVPAPARPSRWRSRTPAWSCRGRAVHRAARGRALRRGPWRRQSTPADWP